MSQTNINNSTGVDPRESDARAGSGRVVDSATSQGGRGGDRGLQAGSRACPLNVSPGKLLGRTVVLTDRMESAELHDRIEKALLMGPEEAGISGVLPGLVGHCSQGGVVDEVEAEVEAEAPAVGHGGVTAPAIGLARSAIAANAANAANSVPVRSIPSVDALPSIPLIASINPEDIHVLVVDDEMMSRTVVSTLLKRFKYTVTTAEDGAEAMELLKSAPPGTYHLVLTDVKMPQMNGIELLQYIRSEETLRSVPVVMMSSFDQGDVICACEEGGAEEYLVKPVTQKEVANIWQHVLKKRGEATTVPQHDEAEEETKRRNKTKQESNHETKHKTNQTAEDEQTAQREEEAEEAEEEEEEEEQRRLRMEKNNMRLMRSLREQSTITGEFLKMMREKRVRELEQLKEQVMILQEDCEAVSCLSERDVVEGHETEDGEEPTRKRRSGTRGELIDQGSVDLSWLNTHGLDASYFAKIHRSTPQVDAMDDDAAGQATEATDVTDAAGVCQTRRNDAGQIRNRRNGMNEEDLREFATSLNAVSQRNTLVVESTIRSGNMANPQEMVCYSDFSVDDAHFATVSVSRSVKVFDHASIAENPNSLQFPVWQATTRFKLSSVSWNSYLRSHLITSDYAGAIQLWDVASGMKNELAQFVEHDKRVWSIDFSTLDPMQFASASDDATVRLWSLQQSNSSVSSIKLPANACSVNYNPCKATMLSVACANHACYVFDTRKTDAPMAVLGGATRAVSYVKHLGGDTVVGASTDNAIRSWDLRKAEGGVCEPEEVYRGHLNERNFVGLSVDGDGYVATGSEDNSVVVYYHKFPFAVCRWGSKGAPNPVGQGVAVGGKAAAKAFTSSVCWARGGRSLLVGNSEGCLALLKMQ